MTVETSEGDKIAVDFDGACRIHARRCVTGEPAAFRANVQGKRDFSHLPEARPVTTGPPGDTLRPAAQPCFPR